MATDPNDDKPSTDPAEELDPISQAAWDRFELSAEGNLQAFPAAPWDFLSKTKH